MILKRVKFLWPHNPFKSIKFPNESNYSELHCTSSGCSYYFQADAPLLSPSRKKSSFPETVYMSSSVTSGFVFRADKLNPATHAPP